MTGPERDAAGELGGQGDVPAQRDFEDRERILKERAAVVARVRAEPRAAGMKVLAFTVGGEKYAVEVKAVFQVLDASGLFSLPASPPWLLGAVAARTRVVPVLDLQALLGLEGGGMSDLSKIVVISDEGELFGLAVEELIGQEEIDSEGLRRAGEGAIAFFAPDRLAVLNLSRLGAPGSRSG
ncbi:MAG TPA: chemotaxis protein CheW [Anaeromyxobacter sp.]|nr:chemotaxis protein CheW [Anaeromyxobacter sp.]